MKKNVEYRSRLTLSPWRKISVGSWKPKGDSSIYVFEDITVDKVLLFCKLHKISFTSFLIKVLSKTIQENPRINSVIRFGNIYQRENISVFAHALKNSLEDDLSGILIENAHTIKIEEVDAIFKNELTVLKEGKDAYVKSKNNFKLIHPFLVKSILNFLSFISYSLNIHLSFLKIPKDSFGSIMLTNVGSLGIAKAFCPIAPYTRIPMVVSVGGVTLKPWIVDGQIQKVNLVTFGFTFDHRIMDGKHFADFITTFRTFFETPELIK
ncbi:2-oxo acid dehydrogenase subunit E2 [Tenacibaculum sp. 190524A02b]|uniref:2-oxoacid_dh domain-containing protein n=1 Tax=Tenacibaculum vairaonense TaxID=3137860 RepID=A0ABM9PHG3_9FLAO